MITTIAFIVFCVFVCVGIFAEAFRRSVPESWDLHLAKDDAPAALNMCTLVGGLTAICIILWFIVVPIVIISFVLVYLGKKAGQKASQYKIIRIDTIE